MWSERLIWPAQSNVSNPRTALGAPSGVRPQTACVVAQPMQFRLPQTSPESGLLSSNSHDASTQTPAVQERQT